MSSQINEELPSLWEGFIYHPHQKEGVIWMKNQEENSSYHGGLLCDEMGLGKTIQSIALLRYRPLKKTLLIAPLSILEQWVETATKANLNVWRPHKTSSQWQMPSPLYAKRPSIFICNYERLLSRPSLVQSSRWDRLICDEAHRITNVQGKTFENIYRILADNKWFLTGTPIVNNIKEISVFLRLLGGSPISDKWEILQPLVSKFCLHRSMNMLRDRLDYLPNQPQEHYHSLDFETKEEQSFYRGIQGAIVQQWNALDGENTGFIKLVLLNRLRQISIHPQVYIANRKKAIPSYSRPDFTGSSTKFSAVKRLIQKENKTPHKWLIFCHFQSEMELLKRDLLQETYIHDVSMYGGKMTADEKTKVIEKTKQPLPSEPVQHEVLLAQLRSGGVGLNLQHFDRILFLGPWWTAALMDQAIGRAVRIGQTEQVHVHYLRLKEEETTNIDLQMFDVVEQKRGDCQRFLESALHLL
jgi:SNF2 family DNA or RNA helicase